MTTYALSNQSSRKTLPYLNVNASNKNNMLPKLSKYSETRPRRHTRSCLISNKRAPNLQGQSMSLVGNSSHQGILTITPMYPIYKGHSSTMVGCAGFEYGDFNRRIMQHTSCNDRDHSLVGEKVKRGHSVVRFCDEARSKMSDNNASHRCFHSSCKTSKKSSFCPCSVSGKSIDCRLHSLSEVKVSQRHYLPSSLDTGQEYKISKKTISTTEDPIKADSDNRSEVFFNYCNSGMKDDLNVGNHMIGNDMKTNCGKNIKRHNKTNADNLESHRTIDKIYSTEKCNKTNIDYLELAKEKETIGDMETGMCKKTDMNEIHSCAKTSRYSEIEECHNKTVDGVNTSENLETTDGKLTGRSAQASDDNNTVVSRDEETSREQLTGRNNEANGTLSKLTKCSTVVLFTDEGKMRDDFRCSRATSDGQDTRVRWADFGEDFAASDKKFLIRTETVECGVTDLQRSDNNTICETLQAKTSDCKAVRFADHRSRSFKHFTNFVKSRYLDKPVSLSKSMEINRRSITNRNKQLHDRMSQKSVELNKKWLSRVSKTDSFIDEIEKAQLGTIYTKQSTTSTNTSVVLTPRVKEDQSEINRYSIAETYSASDISLKNSNPPNSNAHNKCFFSVPNSYQDQLATDGSRMELDNNRCPFNSPTFGKPLISLNSIQNFNSLQSDSLKESEKLEIWSRIDRFQNKGDILKIRKLTNKSQPNKHSGKMPLIPKNIDIGILGSGSKHTSRQVSRLYSRRSEPRMTGACQSANQRCGYRMTSWKNSQSFDLLLRGKTVQRCSQTSSRSLPEDATHGNPQIFDIVLDLDEEDQAEVTEVKEVTTARCCHSDHGECNTCEKVNDWLQYFA